MTVTRLKRKEQRNRSKASDRQARIKQLTAKPVIKNVDIEAIKQEFAEKAAAKAAQARLSVESTPVSAAPRATPAAVVEAPETVNAPEVAARQAEAPETANAPEEVETAAPRVEAATEKAPETNLEVAPKEAAAPQAEDTTEEAPETKAD
ncbi:MAG: hypothetical protein H7Z75_17110 [Ferruginibacter sp.]|nr:hypothetical protein [Cytophagales bacterium]